MSGIFSSLRQAAGKQPHIDIKVDTLYIDPNSDEVKMFGT